MAIISNATTIADAGAVNGLGSLVLIKTITLSSAAANISFVDGASSVVLDDTYPFYRFVFTSIHPGSDNIDFQVNFRDGGSAYDAPKTTTFFRAYHGEGGEGGVLQYQDNDFGGGAPAKTTTYFLTQHSENNDTAQVAYNGTHDLAQGTGFQTLALAQGNANDEGVSGSLTLFNPSSTTFVKHFTSVTNNVAYVDRSFNNTSAGYGNTTSAVDAIQFKFSGGSIGSGIFKLYGIKDS